MPVEAPSQAPEPRVFTLSPGQRLTFARGDIPKLDNPPIDKVTAWQRGQIILDHTPLADAVAEMNRYSPIQLEVQNPQAANTQVTGIFRIGDSSDFAHAVAATYNLTIVEQQHKILITGAPNR
jgi:transmembrane sensor